tara:strand:+ start:916 stop:1086 length:171 start_codon:yes stop_codon:yes gene_type:complete
MSDARIPRIGDAAVYRGQLVTVETVPVPIHEDGTYWVIGQDGQEMEVTEGGFDHVY